MLLKKGNDFSVYAGEGGGVFPKIAIVYPCEFGLRYFLTAEFVA